METWRLWDDQMRKNHKIDEVSDKPIVNINVLAALPPLRGARGKEPELVDVESS